MRILVLCYSQSGDVAKITENFCHPLKRLAGVELITEQLWPKQDYPFPWRTLARLMAIFPECQLGLGNGLRPLSIGSDERFDLVIIAFQVWHLAPSLPMQDLFKSDYAGLLKQTPVVTICVSRNMWHSASERMKRLLQDAGAIHLDNVVVTHQGPPMATLVSVPRLLLFGKRDRLFGVFPAAEISEAELTRVQRLGTALARQLFKSVPTLNHAMLWGQGAVTVNKRFILAELIGAPIYLALARLVLYCEKFGPGVRQAALYGCTLLLVISIVTVVPLTMLLTLLAYPFAARRLEDYAARLAEPSGREMLIDPVPALITDMPPQH
jgi:hypothetical protein